MLSKQEIHWAYTTVPKTYTATDTGLLLLLLLWQASLGVRSTKRRHQSPEWTILSHINCLCYRWMQSTTVILTQQNDIPLCEPWCSTRPDAATDMDWSGTAVTSPVDSQTRAVAGRSAAVQCRDCTQSHNVDWCRHSAARTSTEGSLSPALKSIHTKFCTTSTLSHWRHRYSSSSKFI